MVSSNRPATNQNQGGGRRPVQIQSANQETGNNYSGSQTKYVKYEQPYQEKEIVYDIQGQYIGSQFTELFEQFEIRGINWPISDSHGNVIQQEGQIEYHEEQIEYHEQEYFLYRLD